MTRINCRHCECVFDFDKDDWETFLKVHRKNCKWFRAYDPGDD